jgi:hypothetical protein
MANDLIEPKTYPPDSAMAQLPSDKMRAYIEFKLAGHKPAEAVRLAGYQVSSPQSATSLAYKLDHDPRMEMAWIEMCRAQLKRLGGKAINALDETISMPMHPQRIKAALAVVDRIDPTVQRVEVKHEKVDQTTEALKYLDHLLSLGTPREVLEREFGKFGLSHYSRLLAEKKSAEPKIIDVEYSIVPAEQAPAQQEPTPEQDDDLEDLL